MTDRNPTKIGIIGDGFINPPFFRKLSDPTPFFIELKPAKIFEGLDNIILIAIPSFLFERELMNRSGMADRLLRFSNIVIGRVRGGFAYMNVIASLLPFLAIKGVLLLIIGLVPQLTTWVPAYFGF